MRCKETGKLRWRSQDQAVAHATTLMASSLDAGHRPLNVYRCDFCGDWHVGHRPLVVGPAGYRPSGPPPPVKCACACKHDATEKVWTPNGIMSVCRHHADRLLAVYQQAVSA